MILSIEETQRLNNLCPFWYAKNSFGSTPVKIIEVTRSHFRTEHLSIMLPEEYKDYVFNEMSDFDHHKKTLIVEQYNLKYKSLKESIEYFDEFRGQNPEYFM